MDDRTAQALSAESARNAKLEVALKSSKTIAALARMLWQMTLASDLPSFHRRAHEWMKEIEVGDLVVEMSGWIRGIDKEAIDNVGVITKIEPLRDHDVRVTIETLDGRVMRWTNAEFLRVPMTDAERHARIPIHAESDKPRSETVMSERDILCRAGELVRKSDDNPDLARGGSVAAFLEAARLP